MLIGLFLLFFIYGLILVFFEPPYHPFGTIFTIPMDIIFPIGLHLYYYLEPVFDLLPYKNNGVGIFVFNGLIGALLYLSVLFLLYKILRGRQK